MGLFDTVNEGKSFFEAGTYLATVANVEIVPPSENPRFEEYGPSLKWTFNLSPNLSDPADLILDQDGETAASLWQFSSTKMSPKAKARIWAEAFIGRKLEDGEDVELKDILDRSAIVTLVEEPNAEGKMRAKIAGAKPYDPKAARPQYRTAAKRVAAVESDDGLPF